MASMNGYGLILKMAISASILQLSAGPVRGEVCRGRGLAVLNQGFGKSSWVLHNFNQCCFSMFFIGTITKPQHVSRLEDFLAFFDAQRGRISLAGIHSLP